MFCLHGQQCLVLSSALQAVGRGPESASRDLWSPRKGEWPVDSHGQSVRTVNEGGPPLAWGPQTLPLKGDPTFYIAGGELRSFKPFFLLERRVWHHCLGRPGVVPGLPDTQAAWSLPLEARLPY